MSEVFVRITESHNGLKKGDIIKAIKYFDWDGIYYENDDIHINEKCCEEITLKQLLMRNHTEITTRDDKIYVVVGNRAYSTTNDDTFVNLHNYKDDLTDIQVKTLDIMKITYKDEVLWERQENKRTEMQWYECIEKYAEDTNKYYIKVVDRFSNIEHMIIGTIDIQLLYNEIKNGKWYLCEK